jgi:uncharacterized protein YndB with AHSA1/START domain
MSVRSDASGGRSIQVEVEVPGTPEEVWQAIATGPGVSCWFVPTEIEERDGGGIVSHFGPNMDSVATLTTWDPPRRFAADSPDLGPDAPPLVTEWLIEARSGDTCVVRVINSLFASTDDWDPQLAGIESGWPTFFRILRLYLTHFRGQRCSNIQLVSMAAGPRWEAWNALASALGLAGAKTGQRWRTPDGAPPLDGVIEQIGEGNNHLYALLRLTEPTAGIGSLIVNDVGDKACIQISLYLYGEHAGAAAARDEPLWNAWLRAIPMRKHPGKLW